MKKLKIKHDKEMLTRNQIVKRELEKMGKAIKKELPNDFYFKRSVSQIIDNYLKEKE